MYNPIPRIQDWNYAAIRKNTRYLRKITESQKYNQIINSPKLN